MTSAASHLTPVKMPGARRSGRDARGSLVHLVENADGRARVLLGPALCGRMPKDEWSGWEPDTGDLCPRCEAAAAPRIALASRAPELDPAHLLSLAVAVGSCLDGMPPEFYDEVVTLARTMGPEKLAEFHAR